MQQLIDPEVIKKFNEFKKKYQNMYTTTEWEYVEKYFFKQIKSKYAPNQMMQIYGHLNIYPSPANFYRTQLSLIKENFPIDANIIEVGSGNFPIFAEELAKEQLKLGKGTITIYEPLLFEMTPKYPNMILHKENFTLDTDISKADLIIGIHPCAATRTILESAITNKKDFYVSMCGCDHTPGAEWLDFMDQSPGYFQDDTIEESKRLLRKYPNGHLEVTKLKDYPIPYPILYNKK